VAALRAAEAALFALAFGEGGLLPRDLAAIWASRFGDCKDATRLYVAGARRMGLDVCAALVSTTLGRSLDGLLPSPGLFNHCIARLRLDGKSYWLDPTMQTQCGDLATVFQPQTGWGLPLTPDTAGLEKIADETPLHFINFDEELHFGPKPDAPAKLRRYIEYYFWAADTMRNRIADEGTAKYAEERLKEVQAVWPAVRETAPIEIRDDPKANGLTAILSYEIRDCWTVANKPGRLSFKIIDAAFGGALAPLQGGRSATDIHLARPRKMTRTVRMFMPCRWAGGGWHNVHDAPGVRYVDRLEVEGKTIVHSKELTVDAWSLPALHARDYAKVAGALAENVTSIHARERFGKLRPPVRAAVGNFSGLRAIFFWIWIAIMLLGAIVRTANIPH
jgi:hypothetical protein